MNTITAAEYRELTAKKRSGPWAFIERAILEPQTDECLIWPFRRLPRGYAVVSVGRNSQLVHRIVCSETKGPAPSADHVVRHLCGKGHEGCINPRHLAWGTRAENQADRVAHGTSNRGARHGIAKLTDETVLEIRRRYAAGELQRDLAKQFGVSRGHISQVVTRRMWSWL